MRVETGPSPSPLATALSENIRTGKTAEADKAGKTGKAGKAGASEKDPKLSEAEKVAGDFETLFLDLVMKGMRQTAQPEEQSNAQEIFTGMLDQEYTKSMTEARDFGVRSLILDWMKTADPKLALEAGGLEKAKSASQGIDAYRAQGAIRIRP